MVSLEWVLWFLKPLRNCEIWVSPQFSSVLPVPLHAENKPDSVKLELKPLTVVSIPTPKSASSPPPVHSSIIACLHFFTANFSSEVSLTLTHERMKSISRPRGHFALPSYLNVPNVYSTLFRTRNRLLSETCIEHSHSQRGSWCYTNTMSGPFHHNVAWQHEQGTVY